MSQTCVGVVSRSVSHGPVVLISASGLGDMRTTDGDVTDGEEPSNDFALDISRNRAPRETEESTEAGRDILVPEKGNGGLIKGFVGVTETVGILPTVPLGAVSVD
jgi:hypothetical protein